MRKIATLKNKEQANALRWFLESKGLESATDLGVEAGQECAVWLITEDKMHEAKAFYEEFLLKKDSTALDPMAIEAKKRYEKKIQEEEKRRIFSQRKDNFVTLYPVTFSLICISSLLFFFISQDKGHGLLSFLTFSNDPYSILWERKDFIEISNGQFWRLFSPIFLHQGIFHILFNMMWLFQLGKIFEQAYSSKRLIALVLLTSAVSHIAFYLVAGPAFGGMSGVVYGIFAYLWLMDRYSSRRNLDLNNGQLGQFFLIWYIICLVLSLIGMRIANTIHGVGALVGLVLAYIQSGAYKQFSNQLKHNKNFSKELGYVFLLILAAVLVDSFR